MAISLMHRIRAFIPDMPYQTASFLGLTFSPMTTADAASEIVRMAGAGKPFEYVVTPNVDHMIRLHDDPSLRPLYDGAGLLVNDSRILQTLAERDGLAFPASPGADIVAALFEGEIKADEPVVVIGSTDEDIAKLAQKFGLTNIHRHDAPMGLKHKPEAVVEAAQFIAAHPARFHFICVGSPQQEMVALAARELGTATGVGLCCGASLNFLSGSTARAPAWMRNARLEWLHRIWSEPRRLVKRYLVDGPKIFKIWQNWRKTGKPSSD